MAVRRTRAGIWWWELKIRVGPNLWVVPTLMALLTLGLFGFTRYLDSAIAVPADGGLGWLPEWLTTRSAADAAIVLTALASSLATALALVFSTSILTFALATSQLGPRLIRRFMQDPLTQFTLGLFLSAFLMCVLTLGSVRTGSNETLPRVSIAVSLIGGLSCFVVLIFFVHRIATTIQSPRVVSSVAHDLDRSLEEHRIARSRHPDEADMAVVVAWSEAARSAGRWVPAHDSGYVQMIDRNRLIATASQHDAVVVLAHRPGQFVTLGAPLGWVIVSRDPARMDVETVLERNVMESVEIGPWRTRRQDTEYAINQVVEIAIRALSPAVNDTFTGLTCIDWLGSALSRLGTEVDETGGRCDDDGALRLVEPPLRFERMVPAAFDMIRQAGADNPAILIRLLDTVATIASQIDPPHVPVMARQADVILATAQLNGAVQADLDVVVDRHQRTMDVVEGRTAR